MSQMASTRYVAKPSLKSSGCCVMLSAVAAASFDTMMRPGRYDSPSPPKMIESSMSAAMDFANRGSGVAGAVVMGGKSYGLPIGDHTPCSLELFQYRGAYGPLLDAILFHRCGLSAARSPASRPVHSL